MKLKIFIPLFAFLFFQFAAALASPEDSVKKEIIIPTVIQYISGSTFSSPGLTYHRLDTTMNDFEQVNPAIKSHHNYLSNAGSATSPREFYSSEAIETDIGVHSYDLYLLNDEKIRYFKTNKAFTELNYHLSAGREQQINAALSQNIFKNWNVGIDFNRLYSTGFLRNGTTLHTNIDLYSWFHSKNNRYNLLAFAYWNTIENQVNGGLHNDSIYDHSELSNMELQGLLVNLTDAQNRFSNRKLSLRQFYDLGITGKNNLQDSTSKDQSMPDGRIEHSINLEARSLTYLDTKTEDFYKNSYFNSSTLDSLHYYELRNRFSFSSVINRKDESFWLVRKLYYLFAFDYQWIRYKQFANADMLFTDDVMQNASLAGNLENQTEGTIMHWKATGDYVFAGENKSNYKGELQLNLPVSNYGVLELSGKIYQKSPEIIYRNYYSNHFIWENYFEKSRVKNFHAAYSYPEYHFSIGMELISLTNFIYLDSSFSPVQAADEINVSKYFLTKDFNFRKFHLNNSFILQKVNNEDRIHLPSLMMTQSLFYESFLYKSALLLRVGFDLHYHASYYADGFMPATGLFYRQYEKKTGGYPLLDFFFSIRIKTANLFVKLENIGDGLFANGYYLTPHYPMQGMGFQLGVRWRFFDQQ